MDEKQKIAYYDAHRGEPQEITDVTPSSGARKRDTLTVTVAVRFSAPEAEALSETAKREGKTFSEIIRTAVQRYTRPQAISQEYPSAIVLNYDEHIPQTRGEIGTRTLVMQGGSASSETRSSMVLAAH
jgi:hypothetical protein